MSTSSYSPTSTLKQQTSSGRKNWPNHPRKKGTTMMIRNLISITLAEKCIIATESRMPIRLLSLLPLCISQVRHEEKKKHCLAVLLTVDAAVDGWMDIYMNLHRNRHAGRYYGRSIVRAEVVTPLLYIQCSEVGLGRIWSHWPSRAGTIEGVTEG